MADQSEKSKYKEVSSESRVEREASRVGSDQAQADMPEHLQNSQKEKRAFDKAGLNSTARSHVSETFGRPEISEESDGEKILHVAEVSDKKAAQASDPYPSYTRGIEAARKTAATPEEVAQLEVQFTEQYIEKKYREATTTPRKDPAELYYQHEFDPEDPNHGGTFAIPQNVAEKHSDGSVLLKINVTESDRATEDAARKKSPDGWLEAGRRIAELPLDKQFEIIGSGLAAGINQDLHDENQRAWGRVIGTVQGICEVSINLAKVADFSAALILNDEERAGKMGAEFGQALGEIIVGGVRLFNVADQYLFNIGFTGDYAKPFRDIGEFGNAMNQKWASLPPKEQERIKFKLLTELGADTVIGGAGIHSASKAGKLTDLLDDIADQMAKQGTKTLEGAKNKAKAIKEGLEDLMLPEAVTPDGQSIRIIPHRETNVVYSQGHKPDGSGRPHSDRPSESASGHPGDRTRHRESDDEDVFKPRDMRAEIDDALEVLEPSLKSILEKYKVKIEIIDQMDDAFPGDLEKIHFMGAYDWGRNTIFLPKRVLQNGKLVDNFDIDFVIRHEIGHAFNSKVMETPNLYYARPKRISDKSQAFFDAFNRDIARIPDSALKELKFNKTTEAGLQFARDEVFADTFAHAIGFPTKNPWSQLIKRYFGDTLTLMKEKIRV